MVALIIFLIATAAAVQFGLSWWRAMIIHLAECPLSERGKALAERFAGAGSHTDFDVLASIHESCPPVSGADKGLGAIRAYVRVLSAVKSFCQRWAPAMAAWAQKEMQTCFRFAAVRVDQRLAHTQELWAELRTM